MGLDKVISIGECGILRDPRGWVFSEDLGEVDPVLKIHYLDDAYLKGDPEFTGRSTVPAIADIKSGAVVQNEAWEIPKYLITDWERFHKENAPDLYPNALQEEIDGLTPVIKLVNAYACGFARNQESFDEGYKSYFKVLDQLEERLSRKRFLHGDFITLSDIHLFVALIRFHINYHLVFGVNKKRLEDYPNLWGYTRDLYQTVYGLLGVGPDNSKLLAPTGREKLSGNPKQRFVYKNSGNKHDDVNEEIRYLKEELINPIERAGKATFQTDLERWAHIEEDTLKEIDKRLSGRRFLTGNEVTEADRLLYQTLLKHDYIYYYLYKLNFAKTYDYENIRRYEKDLDGIEAIVSSIDIEKEKEEAFNNLPDERNPYHLVFRGPEK